MNEKFNLFTEQVVAGIKVMYPNADVSTKQFTKNNDTVLTGLMIKEDDSICPVIYLDSFFEKYDGDVSSRLLNIISATYEQAKVSDIDLDIIQDYDSIKSHLRVKLINKKDNPIYLSDAVYKTFMDLAIVAIINASDIINLGKGLASIKVTSGMLTAWGVSHDQVISDAINCTFSETEFSVEPIGKVLRDMMPDLFSDDIPFPEVEDEYDAFYVCKAGNLNGSVAMLFQDKITEFAKNIGSDLYILPSSIHEVLLVPVNQMRANYDDLRNMVCDVNSSEVEDSEVLSDHPYFFSRDNGYFFNI